ncbi:preprotein translocase subunit SecA [Kocuria rhizophila]|uniref:Protein translocase subunit SecA n=1 Tax=Kocuria rhizophila (strain ATCC 9341 / DSM 348 / NBRC 103217 / DC2201) TaxID=378753 RepID=SECA_KOCRD|nr:preprotein translocase subunit SecA [Kocuria rhizophila]B2GL56.1 RecName: Full=Protein translocase subunit SecA [Kocuria rhizophila DC2201]ASE10830.1 protein translocase subunit SecA [Kocuria rhizophila]BAG29232.1 preprotein translocase SecA subunit [Kocuria rhizophila DC2201]VEH75487.1 preprotein translocase subunit SecA [Kocuria rhizophila]
MASFLEKVLRTGDKRVLKRLRTYADAVNSLEDSFKELSDAELRAETDAFRERIADGESLDRLLPEAFAAVREAASRTLGQRHFDVQIMGGAALHLGYIAEMKTGEGKTLVATAPAYLNALAGKGVHVVTVNDYLAEYQANLMGRVYRFLGLETGVILGGQEPAVRREQYAADITYGTNNEFGFDYLRDNMAWTEDELVQRGHNFAIVDEVDSILIDEARTPLIISGPASGEANRWYREFATVVQKLSPETDYEVDEKKRTVGVLEPGIEKVEDWLGIDNLYESRNTPLIGFLNNAIKAKELFRNNKDYIVAGGEVKIVDEHTGRVLAGRRYNEGVHQAIEAKEGVEIKPENQTMATITLQNYFRLYDKLSGMTGTAQTEAAEFMNTYEIGVVAIPPHRGIAREDKRDVVYKNEATKYAAVVRDIEERHEKGQPVLVGTASVEKSEYLSRLLAKRGVRHEVLNAKNHAREAAIVAQAGRKGAVTVATNMAGRGTDIMLGGNAEFNAVDRMAELGLDPERDAEEYEARWPEVLKACEEATRSEHEEVLEAGGLYVLGTERHESRRIDNQLRGRSGRQGDPGESRFYLSLSDDLMRLFNPGAAQRLMAIAPDDVPVTGRLITSGIANAQNQVEGRNAEQRKNVLKYDDVLNRQREVIYKDRKRILMGDDIEDQIRQFTEEVLSSTIAERTGKGHPEDWDLDGLWEALRAVYPVSLTPDEVVEEAGGRPRLTSDFLQEQILSDATVMYLEREEELGSEAMRNLERRVLLSVIGQRWPEHLYEMDYLKEGIGLRAMAQRDPLVEYQREGHAMFQDMMAAIREQTVVTLFNLEVRKQRTGAAGGAVELSAPQRPAFLQYTAPDEDGTPHAEVEAVDPGARERTSEDGTPTDASAGTDPAASSDRPEGETGGNRAKRRGASARSGSKAKRGKRR